MNIKKNEALFLISNILNQITLYIYDVFIIFLLYNRNIVELSGFFLATILPATIVMFTGIAFDKYNRKNILIFVNLLKIILISLLIFSQNSMLIYVVTFICSCLAEITSNGNAIIARQIATDNNLKSLLVRQNFINSLATVIGPVLSGVIIAFFNNIKNVNTTNIIIAIIVVCLLISTILFKFIDVKNVVNDNSTRQKNRINFEYFDINIIKITLMWCAFMFVIGIGAPLEVKFIQSVLNLDVEYYAFGNSIEGIGNLFISVFLMIYIKKLNTGTSIKLGLLISSLAYLIIGISQTIYTYAIGAILVGMAAGITPFSFKMFYQINVDDQILGRVFSTSRFMVLLSRMLGLFFVSVFLQFTNIRTLYFINTLICITLIILINIFERKNKMVK